MQEYSIRQKNQPLSHEFYERYCDDFPFEERKPLEKLNSMLKNAAYRFFEVINNENNKSVAYFITYCGEKLALVDYFAVDKTERGTGIGSLALSLIRSELKKPILLEIEPADGDENSFPSRRRRFYLKNGAIPIKKQYFLPTPDGKMKMELLYLPYNDGGKCENNEQPFEPARENLVENALERTSEKNAQALDFSMIAAFLREAISFIHSDIAHVNEVIEGYIGGFEA